MRLRKIYRNPESHRAPTSTLDKTLSTALGHLRKTFEQPLLLRFKPLAL